MSNTFSDIEILRINRKGDGLAEVSDRLLPVPDTAPGDRVNLEIRGKGKRRRGRVVNFLSRGPGVRDTPCSHAGVCGGCRFQHITYDGQLAIKQDRLKELFDNRWSVDQSEVHPPIAAPAEFHYRNKMEFSFAHKRWLTKEELEEADGPCDQQNPGLGLHVRGMFSKVVDLQQCLLHRQDADRLRAGVREIAVELGLSFYDSRAHRGCLRTLLLRTTSTGDRMLALIFGEQDQPAITQMMAGLADRFPELTSLLYMVNEKKNDSYFDLPVVQVAGSTTITEQVGDLSFRIGPKTFFQVNLQQTPHLLECIQRLSRLEASDIVYDLYAGTGSISLYLARTVQRCIGIEQVEPAVADAKDNTARNGISNCRFYVGNVEQVLTSEFAQENGLPSHIILDPPRSGCHPKVIRELRRLAAPSICYMSCNPERQAEDVEALSDLYRVTDSQAVDMFPQTPHIENVMRLELRTEQP